MRTYARTFLFLLLAAFLMLSGCRTDQPGSDYEREILQKITDDLSAEDRLPAFTEDLCVIDPDADYDETLIAAQFAGLFNETTKEVLYAKNASGRIYPASMTKTMTALLTVENCPDLSEMVTVTEEMVAGLKEGSSLAGLSPGDSYSVSDLLAGLLIPSGNDAANVLAYHVGGSIEGFVQMMNERAKELGMLNTHYVNAHGLHDKNHYTTVYDLYLLMRQFLLHRELTEFASAKDATGAAKKPDGSYEVKSWRSANSISLGYTELPKGLTLLAAKTGYTVSAGRCLVIAVHAQDGSDYIAVIAKAESHDALYEQTVKLLSEIPGTEAP